MKNDLLVSRLPEAGVFSEKHKARLRFFDASGTKVSEKNPGFTPIPEVKSPKKSDKFDIDAQYAKERRERPEIFDMIVARCWKLRKLGFTRYSIQTVIEAIRWHEDLKSRDGNGWNMNNNCTSRYAREVMTIEGLEDFFETRGLKS
jgi:hypothetical protein